MLTNGRVADVWVIDLKSIPSVSAWHTVTRAEQARAARLASRVRTSFLATRAATRQILAAYIGTRPRDLPLRQVCRFCNREGHGKPVLEVESSFSFSVSRTRCLSLVAVAEAPSTGVDLELIDPSVDIDAIAGGVFSRRELATLMRMRSRPDRAAAFFRGWTRKEAITKATGEGLTRDWTKLDVPLTANFVGTVASDASAEIWELSDIDQINGYAGAIALPAQMELALRRFVWDRNTS